MSLMTSMYTATGGLHTNSLELSVVGDNIANANTVGFKAGRAAFEDALAINLMGGGGQQGLGTRIQAIQKLITQGALTSTGLATDLALQGAGFFVVEGEQGGQQGRFYTRAGQFTIDNDGMLVNLDGLRVMGYRADAAGNLASSLSDLPVGAQTSAPFPSSEVQLDANLQSDAPLLPAFDPTDPANTSNFATGVTLYDSLGNARQADVYFRRTGAGTWEWFAMTDGSNVTGGTAGTLVQVANGTLTFDTQGRLTAETQASNFNPLGAVNPQPLTFDFGDPTGAGGTGVEGITQYANPSAATFVGQNGYGAGALSSIQINAAGEIVGAFSNGQTRIVGQVAVGQFTAADQLQRIGGNLFQETLDSGQPTIGAAGTGGRGSIVAGALEQSNVDLATEFVRMIAAQRGFQANSKTITTADQLLGELMTLKR